MDGMKRKRLQRSNYNGQEEMVSALWEFAADVIRAGNYGAFTEIKTTRVEGFGDYKSHTVPISTEQLSAIHKAMERISKGFGYRVLEIQ